MHEPRVVCVEEIERKRTERRKVYHSCLRIERVWEWRLGIPTTFLQIRSTLDDKLRA